MSDNEMPAFLSEAAAEIQAHIRRMETLAGETRRTAEMSARAANSLFGQDRMRAIVDDVASIVEYMASPTGLRVALLACTEAERFTLTRELDAVAADAGEALDAMRAMRGAVAEKQRRREERARVREELNEWEDE